MTSVLKIGRTNYYSVRKGTQQYCVAEGKRLQDAEYCWQSVKDPETGKTFFISGTGVRRWHLPDIHLTEKERLEEERELKFRREQKAIEDARLSKQRAGDAALLEGGASQDMAQPVGGEDPDAKFAARDRAAMNATLLSGWETPEQRRPVTRFVKSVFQPHITQKLLDEKTFTQLVTTVTREHCSATAPPFTKSQEPALREMALEAAKQRVDEERRKAEYEKLTEELKEKVRRLEAERRKMQSQIDTMSEAEEKIKDELFSLRAHKQDTLLTGFKRLTRVGLINAYWERWVKHKSVVEAQLHVKARERRQHEMTERVSELEAKVFELQESNSVLRKKVQQQQGRDVVATLLNTHGKSILKRFYLKWLVYSEHASREREYFKVKQMLIDCPTCKLRSVEVERLHERLNDAVQNGNQMQLRCCRAEEGFSRLLHKLEESQSITQIEVTNRQAANMMLNDRDRMIRQLNGALEEADRYNCSLHAELQRLQFETEQYHEKSGPGTVRSQTLLQSMRSSTLHGEPRSISNFFAVEAARASQQSLQKISGRPNAAAVPSEEAVSGAIRSSTERSIAPNVFAERPPNPLSKVEESRRNVDALMYRHSSVVLNPPPLSKKTSTVVSSVQGQDTADRDTSPSTGSSTSSSSSSSSSDTDETNASSRSVSRSPQREQPETYRRASSPPTPSRGPTDERCLRCGFSMALTQFCPIDGSRHRFESLVSRNTVNLSLNADDKPGQASFFSSQLRGASKKDVLATGNVLSLPPPRQFDRNTGQWTRQAPGHEVGDDVPPPPVLPHTAALRASLSLNAHDYKPQSFQSTLGVAIGEPQTESKATNREIADYMRATQLVASANSLTKHTLSAQEAYPSLSLDSRMFSKRPDDIQPRNSSGPSWNRWGAIFDANDTVGVFSGESLTSTSDRTFGVYRRDELPLASREELERQQSAKQQPLETRGTPNMVMQGHR